MSENKRVNDFLVWPGSSLKLFTEYFFKCIGCGVSGFSVFFMSHSTSKVMDRLELVGIQLTTPDDMVSG